MSEKKTEMNLEEIKEIALDLAEDLADSVAFCYVKFRIEHISCQSCSDFVFCKSLDNKVKEAEVAEQWLERKISRCEA